MAQSGELMHWRFCKIGDVVFEEEGRTSGVAVVSGMQVVRWAEERMVKK